MNQQAPVSLERQRPYFSAVVVVGLLLPGAILLLSLSVGRYPLTLSQLLYIVTRAGDVLEGKVLSAHRLFWYVRLPRSVLVLLAGGALALAGTVLQGVLRNPLVSPDIIGVSAGASLGAALAIVVANADPEVVQIWAFIGGLAAALSAFFLSRATGSSIISLVLAGIIINSLAQAGVSLLKYVADPFQQLPL